MDGMRVLQSPLALQVPQGRNKTPPLQKLQSTTPNAAAQADPERAIKDLAQKMNLNRTALWRIPNQKVR
ncbi:hypothetical protein SI65_08196 [Aspergillus cristatus]|uniref:Uncharacterized protein n=1 Tax=Aspergillus cristatus TaxID=573508 RepID=A0A1E3B5H5_ASPCR|nr:hypothetical protein SI65_08196 [Aspergillus cristatus]